MIKGVFEITHFEYAYYWDDWAYNNRDKITESQSTRCIVRMNLEIYDQKDEKAKKFALINTDNLQNLQDI
jgi:hypothetical protein